MISSSFPETGDSEVSSFPPEWRCYLEMVDSVCDLLEVVVAALSSEKPLWLDSRLLMEPLIQTQAHTSLEKSFDHLDDIFNIIITARWCAFFVNMFLLTTLQCNHTDLKSVDCSTSVKYMTLHLCEETCREARTSSTRGRLDEVHDGLL